jgi:acetyl-CoA C-acetyltransferase
VENRRSALRNPFAAYGADLAASDVLAAPALADPLTELDVSQTADGAAVLVLAAEDAPPARRAERVRIRGIGWATDEPSLSGRSWSEAMYARLACQMAYKQARIRRPSREIDILEVDDTYAYKELLHLDAALLQRPGKGAAVALRDGRRDLRPCINPSGGNLGMGYGFDASALFRTAMAVLQLRGQAGGVQVSRPRTAAVVSWRGVPTTTGGAVVLGAA